MRITFSTRSSIVVVAGLLVCWMVSATHAQSDSELRRQNEQLTAQAQELQEKLDAAERENAVLKERISALEQQLAAARRAGSAKPSKPAPEPEKVTVDETNPLASPRALFKALQTSLLVATKDTDPGKPGDSKRRAYLKKLESWTTNIERQHRGSVIWHVRVIDARPGPRTGERIVTFKPVDPVTDVALGNNFDVILSRTLSDRLAVYEERGELGVLVLRGSLMPDITINEQRTERGSFDNPPYLGMFTEFGYLIDIKSLMTVEDDKAREGATTKPADAPRSNPSR
jgi:hypothetical protein